MPNKPNRAIKVVALADPKSDQPLRRTVTAPSGATYHRELSRGEPHLLLGQHEIDAFRRELSCGRLAELRLTGSQSEKLFEDLADRNAKSKVAKLAAEVEKLRAELDQSKAFTSEDEEE